MNAATRGLARLALGIAVVLGAVASAVPAAAQQSPLPSSTPSAAIEPATIQWLAVSPAYQHTGVVAAVGVRRNCSKDCAALWVSRDGGASWHRAAARDWLPRRLTIAVDGQRHEVFYGSGSRLVMRSDDLGETFVPVGTGGMPTILPRYAADGALVVASLSLRADYILQGGNAHDVTGSNNQDTDLQFALSPAFPQAGSSSPALLAALNRTGHPVVLRCTADFTCANPVSLMKSASPYAAGASTILTLSPDYSEDGVVFANTSSTIEKSTDGGATFTPVTVVPPLDNGVYTALPMLALAPGYREAGPVRTAYITVTQVVTGVGAPPSHPQAPGGLYKTDDGGATWSPLATTGPFAGGASAVAVAPDGRLFAGFNDGRAGGLVCSTDDGVSWHAACPAVGDHLGVASSPSPASALGPVAASQTDTGDSSGHGRWVLVGAAVFLVLLAALILGPLRHIRGRRRSSTSPD